MNTNDLMNSAEPLTGPVHNIGPAENMLQNPGDAVNFPAMPWLGDSFNFFKNFQEKAQNIGSYEWLKSQALQGDAEAIDALISYELSEMSANSARSWTAQREDSSYQRAVADLKKAGLNPWILASGGFSGFASSGQQNSYTRGQYTSSEQVASKNKTTERGQNLDFISDIIGNVLKFISTMSGNAMSSASRLASAAAAA